MDFSFCASPDKTVVGLIDAEPQGVQPRCRQPENDSPATNGELREPRYLACRPIDDVTLLSDSGHLVAVNPIPIKRVYVVQKYGQADSEEQETYREQELLHGAP